MIFHFSLEKATQASAVLLRETQTGSMEYLRLIKLLYLAERKSIEETGHPIIGDRYCSLNHGPVLSKTLDLIKGKDVHSREWRAFFETSGYELTLKGDPGNGALCRYEVELLQAISKQNAEKNEWQIVQETHALPEWKNPHDSMTPIDHLALLRILKKSEAEIEAIRQEAACGDFADFAHEN